MFVRNEHHPFSRFTGGIARRGPVRTLGLVLAMVAMTALFANTPRAALAGGDQPTAPSGSSFQDGESGGNGGIFWDPATEETPVADDASGSEETPAADETVADDQTSEAEIQGVQGDLSQGRIMVYMRECDSTLGLSFATLDKGCWNNTQIAFELYSGIAAIKQTGEQGAINASGLPSGGYTIREYVPDEYTEPTVFCGHPGRPDSAFYQVVTVDGYYEFELDPSDTVVCHFFNLRRDRIQHHYGGLYLYKMVCPANSTFDYYGAGVDELKNRCPLFEGTDVSFNAYSTVDQTNQPRSVNENAAYSWPEIEGGAVAITEINWAVSGGQVVYCTLFGGSEQTQWGRADAAFGTAQVNVTSGKKTVCYWFSIPGAPRVATAVASTVAIATYSCDGIGDDIDPYVAEHDQLLAECQPSAGGEVSFDVAANAVGDAGIAASAVDGGTVWENVAAGDLTVSGQGADGYGRPVVFCAINNPAMLVFESVYEKVETQGGSFGYQLDEGYSLNCDWFAIPGAAGGDASEDEDGDVADAGTGSVSVVAYSCPEGADAQAEFEGFQEGCTAVTEGAIFKLDGASSGNPGEKTTGADGSVTWANREADHYYLYRQEVPEGYRTPAVFCASSSNAEYASYRVGDGWRIEADLAEGESIECAWFDFSGDVEEGDGSVNLDGAEESEGDGDVADAPGSSEARGSISIYEWVCPAGFDVAAAEASPWTACAVASEGVGLTISGPDGFAEQEAAGDDFTGGVRWDGLAAGDYQIADAQPEDGAAGVVLACHGMTAPASYPVYSTESGTPMAIGLADGQQVACFWFEVPAEA